MKTITINKREYELNYTFNSFKYMGDFDIAVLQKMDQTPFKMATYLDMLLLGALNHDPRKKVPAEMVTLFLEEYVVDGDMMELFNELMDLLQESRFFKALQKTE